MNFIEIQEKLYAYNFCKVQNKIWQFFEQLCKYA